MNEAELSQILREQFRLLGEQIGHALNVPEPLKPLLEGEEAVCIFRLHKGNLKLVVPLPPKPEQTLVTFGEVETINEESTPEDPVITEIIAADAGTIPESEPKVKVTKSRKKKK